jgi:hypothetical protein
MIINKDYTVGDTVRVKPDLCLGIYDGLLFAREMLRYRGQVFVVESTTEKGNYRLRGIRGYVCNDEMLEPYCEPGVEFDIPYNTTEINSYLKSGGNIFDIFIEKEVNSV